ncbi:MAG TPA: metallophosphoesterase [Solimonas sp.]|nr:metallophosphoesterase [Solimonas sp.]
MLLLQISDTHFGTERPEVVEALVREADALAPDAVLLVGDITQRARAAQFAAAAEVMARLPGKLHVAVPGNHDLPLFNLVARLFWPYAGFEKSFGPRRTLWSGQGLTLLALDATHPKRHKNGELPALMLRERLAEARSSAGPDGLLVLAAHQPLWTAWQKDGHQTLLGRDQTALILAEHRVDLVLSGHVHVPLIGLSTIGFKLPWTYVLSGTGTAVSDRTRAGAPNSFNLIEVTPGAQPRIELSRYDYAATGFGCAERRGFRRGETGWVEG